LRNNIVWGNNSPSGVQIQLNGGTANVTYCDVQGGYTGAGNLNANPVFADTNYIHGDNSPCIDKGDSSLICNDPEDPLHSGFALYPSKGTTRNDMGAYGGPGRDKLSAILIGIRQLGSEIPKLFKLYQNYPNPFNPITKIHFDVPFYVSQQTSNVKLTVYDIMGKTISVLIYAHLKPGVYEIEWNGLNYTSGVYFYRISAGDFSQTNKMILLK
jgi:hypothetical protein